MSQKSKKRSIWHSCDVCQSKFLVKDLPQHGKKSCPPTDKKKLVHPYFKEKTLYTSLEEMDDALISDMLNIFPRYELSNIICLSREVLRLGRWNVGDPVLVVMKGRPVVKTVWPCKGKTLMGSVMLKEFIEGMWGVRKGEVTVRHLTSQLATAKQVLISAKGAKLEKKLDSEHIASLLRGLYTGKHLHIGTKIWLPYYGKKLLVNVKSTTGEEASLGDVTFESSIGEAFDSTSLSDKYFPESDLYASTPKRPSQPITQSALLKRKCSAQENSLDDSGSVCDKSQKSLNTSSSIEVSMQELENNLSQLSLGNQEEQDIFRSLCTVTERTEFVLDVESSDNEKSVEECTEGTDIQLCGLSTVENKLQCFIVQALESSHPGFSLKKPRGFLLYGPSGTGKTQLIRAVAHKLQVPLCEMQSADIYSKFLGETESRLKKFFDDCKRKAPAVILFEKIDWFTPSNLSNSGATDLGRRAIDSLALNLDSLQECNVNVAVIGTACSLDAVDSSLRRPGRFDCEEEVPLPDPTVRLEILESMLDGTAHSLSRDDLQAIANSTYGFVGGDIASLGSHALLHMSRMNREEICYEDFTWALTRVSPSAMREVQVDIPNVRWTDIAGQEDLKLKLRQSVEWPLTHPEAFVRLGIRPPRGILMYGPPGCSKTMIARAVATESKLNFISIKGSELFSKWVGESERAVREVFRRARLVAPSVIFFDELDAIGGERFTSGSGTRSVESRVLTQLLTEMDGVEDLEKVIVVGGTNRPDRIDKALLRPGRMDNIIYVPLPDDETRKEIFRRQFMKMPVDFTNLDNLVKNTSGYSGAEVVAVCHEAGRLALADDLSAKVVGEHYFYEALREIKPRTPESLLKLYESYQKSRL